MIALAPRVTPKMLTVRVAERTPAVGNRRMTVGLLTGCVQRVMFGHVNQATINVLSAEGCDVVAPADQECCGALALHAGRLDEARESARRTIASFERTGVEPIVIERAPELREAGFGLVVSANAVTALRSLGLSDAVAARGSRVRRAEVRNPRGDLLTQFRQ